MHQRLLFEKMLYALLVWLALFGNAIAGAEPTPIDQFPTIQIIEFSGNDIVFENRYQINNGNWDTWSGPFLDNKDVNQYTPKARVLACSIPEDVQRKYSEAQVIYCDSDRVWFATSGYCEESQNDQGVLYSYAPKTGAVSEYTGFIPKCNAFPSVTRIGNTLWATSVTPGEYGPGGGEVLIFDLSVRQAIAKRPPAHKFTGTPFYAIAYQPEYGYVWVATTRGIDRFSLKEQKWDQRYFDIEITANNKLKLILAKQAPPTRRLWLAYHLYFQPIEDMNGFARAWGKINAKELDKEWLSVPYTHTTLLPYYIAALQTMDEKWNDYGYVNLLRLIASHEDGSAQIRALLVKLNAQPMSQIRRSAVVELSAKYGLGGAGKSMGDHFESLMQDYFTRGTGLLTMCEFAFKNVQYLPRLNEYYLTHNLLVETNNYFLDDCIRSHSSFPSAPLLLPSVVKALNQGDGGKPIEVNSREARSLTAMCAIFNHYAKEDWRRPELVWPILKARSKSKADFAQKGYGRACVSASYWITNRATGIDELLAGVDVHPELKQMAIDVLGEVTGKKFQGIPEWKEWWGSHRVSFKPRNKKYYYDESYQ